MYGGLADQGRRGSACASLLVQERVLEQTILKGQRFRKRVVGGSNPSAGTIRHMIEDWRIARHANVRQRAAIESENPLARTEIDPSFAATECRSVKGWWCRIGWSRLG